MSTWPCLKGVIYNAKILSTPASIVILAVTQFEAKIECIANDYIQLRGDPNANLRNSTLDGFLAGGVLRTCSRPTLCSNQGYTRPLLGLP